jgi:hypothetical protein
MSRVKRDDIDKLNYQGKVQWYKERLARIEEPLSEAERRGIPREEEISPEVLKNNFIDLQKKATKLDRVIDELSSALYIPIDKEQQPKVAYAVNIMDPASGGERISYSLYRDLMAQRERGQKNITLDWALTLPLNDSFATSDAYYKKYIDGASSFKDIPDLSLDVEGAIRTNPYGSQLLDTVSAWNDYEMFAVQILDFVGNFLVTSDDTRYIPWGFKGDIGRKLTDFESVIGLLDNFIPSQDDPINFLSFSHDLWDILSGKRDADNEFFDDIHDILISSLTPEMLCCFIGWAGNLDSRTLRALRVILDIFSRGLALDLKALINALLSIINDFFRNMLLYQLVAIFNRILQMVVDPIRKWLDTDDETWRKIFLCTPIDDLIHAFIIVGIDRLTEWFNDKMMDLFKKIEIDKIHDKEKVTILKKRSDLDKLVKLLDILIDAIGRMEMCGNTGAPTGDYVRRFLDTHRIGPAWRFSYGSEENPNIYNSFYRTKTIVSEFKNKDGAIEVSEESSMVYVTGSEDFVQDTSEINIDECLSRVSDENVFSVKEWMNDLRAKSAEEVNV